MVKSMVPAVFVHRSESACVLFQWKVAFVPRAGLLSQVVLRGLQEVQVCAKAWGRRVAASPERANERERYMINAAVAGERGAAWGANERSAREPGAVEALYKECRGRKI